MNFIEYNMTLEANILEEHKMNSMNVFIKNPKN